MEGLNTAVAVDIGTYLIFSHFIKIRKDNL